jgi:hypothetical protein
VFYGTEGAIYIKGHYGSGQLYVWGKDKCWNELPLPKDIVAGQPTVDGETERCWHYLAKEFVKDIQGETVEPYPTFKEGSQYQQIIDLIRKNDNWTDVRNLA